MTMSKEALSLDIDGVTVWRPPFQLSAILGYLKHGSALYNPPIAIPILERKIDTTPISRKETISFIQHLLRPVFPCVRQTLPEVNKSIFVNTGRPNRTCWIDMTKNTFKRGGILDLFDGFYFRPRETPTLISKIAAIQELRDRFDKVTHVDDNPADALPIAALFPDVEVIIIQDLSTGILLFQVKMNKFPNVRRVATFREILKST